MTIYSGFAVPNDYVVAIDPDAIGSNEYIAFKFPSDGASAPICVSGGSFDVVNPLNPGLYGPDFLALINTNGVTVSLWYGSNPRSLSSNYGGYIYINNTSSESVPTQTFYLFGDATMFYVTDTPPQSSGSACFSELTFRSILSHNKLNQIITVQSYRGNKKMYRCIHPIYGTIEFTFDHPFIFNNTLYLFEDLINIHPILKKTAKEIPLDDLKCGSQSKIYNIIGHPQQMHAKNTFDFGLDLKMIGGWICTDDVIKIGKKVKITEKLLIDRNDNNCDVIDQCVKKYTNINNLFEHGEKYDMVEYFMF